MYRTTSPSCLPWGILAQGGDLFSFSIFSVKIKTWGIWSLLLGKATGHLRDPSREILSWLDPGCLGGSVISTVPPRVKLVLVRMNLAVWITTNHQAVMRTYWSSQIREENLWPNIPISDQLKIAAGSRNQRFDGLRKVSKKLSFSILSTQVSAELTSSPYQCSHFLRMWAWMIWDPMSIRFSVSGSKKDIHYIFLIG